MSLPIRLAETTYWLDSKLKRNLLETRNHWLRLRREDKPWKTQGRRRTQKLRRWRGHLFNEILGSEKRQLLLIGIEPK